MFARISIVIFFLFVHGVFCGVFAQNLSPPHTFRQAGSDLKTSLKTSAYSFKYQFMKPASYALLATIGATAIALHNDKDWSQKIWNSGPVPKEILPSLNALGVILVTPLPFLAAWLGPRSNPKYRNFAIQGASSFIICGLEAVGLSFIPIHERPPEAKPNFWEKRFRSKSSFPSGHILGFSTLSTTLLFYSPPLAYAGFALTLLQSVSRIQEKKHYVSDVVGGIGLGIITALAVQTYFDDIFLSYNGKTFNVNFPLPNDL